MKAYPFHHGHEFLISEALRRSERVSVFVVWGAGQDPDGATRAGWIRQTFPNVTVYEVVDIFTDTIDDAAKGTANEEAVQRASSRMWAVYTRDILKGDDIDAITRAHRVGRMGHEDSRVVLGLVAGISQLHL